MDQRLALAGTSGTFTSTARRRSALVDWPRAHLLRAFLERLRRRSGTVRIRSRPQFYAEAYARRGGMRAGFEVFRAFEQDAKDFARFARGG